MHTAVYIMSSVLIIISHLPIHTHNKAKSKRAIPNCALGRWRFNGTHRVWKRRCYETRRIREVMSVKMGKPHDSHYAPNYGYEPYWSEGGWVFDLRPTTLQAKGLNFVCGEVCPVYAKDFGKVCARDKKYKYKTFDNYCLLKEEDCEGTQGWMVLYRGECQPDLQLYSRWGYNNTGMIKTKLSSRINFLEHLVTSKYFGFAEPFTPWTKEEIDKNETNNK